MSTLPQVHLPYDDPFDLKTLLYYSSNVDRNSYNELIKLIEECVGADCWALTVDDQIVFNSYPEVHERDHPRSIRQEILEKMIRDSIDSDVHGNLLVHLFRRDKNCANPLATRRIRIYMFREDAWTMNIDYKPIHKVFQVSFSKSK
jgi:hypothetical protein